VAKETLRIELKVDGAAQATLATKQVQGGVLSLSGTVDRASATLMQMRTILTGLAVGGLGALVRSTVNAADELSKLSTRLGISVESLSQLQFAADRSGVSFDAMTTALQRQTRRVAEAAKGTGEAVKAFQELGLSAEKIKSLAPDQQFEVLAEALSGVADSGDRVRLAMKFWDSEGVKLLQVAEGGADAVRALRDQSDALGRTLSAETAAAAAKLNDQMRNLGGSLEGVGNQMASAVIPWLAEWANALNTKTIPAIMRWWESLTGVRTEIEKLSVARLQDAMTALATDMQETRLAIDEARDAVALYSSEDRRASTRMATARAKARAEVEALNKKLDEQAKEYRKLFERQSELVTGTEKTTLKLADYEGTTNSAAGATGKLGKSSQALKKDMSELEKQITSLGKTMERDLLSVAAPLQMDNILAAWANASDEIPAAWKATAKEGGEEIKKEIDRTSDWMAQSLTDAIMRGFEGGAGFVENFIATLKNWFSTLILRPIIQPIAAGIVGGFGMGTPGTAGAGGMGGFSSLSNLSSYLTGSSIAGGLNAGASFFGLGPTGIPSASTGLDAAQLFGGANFGYGLSGLAGGLIGRFVGNGSTASQLGGSLGGMAGFGLTAAGGALSGTALGATLGTTIFPVVGTLVGALLGTLIGSLLGGSKGDKSPDLQVTAAANALRPDEIRTTQSGGTNIQSLFVPSPFGGLSYTTKHDAFGSMEDAQAFASALSAVGMIETALSDLVGTEKTDEIAAALGELMGDSMRKLAENPDEWESGLEALFTERFDTAFAIIGGQMERVYRSIGDGAAVAAEATLYLFNALDSLASVQQTYNDLVEQQGRSLYEVQRLHARGLSDLIDGYRGGLEATQDLTAALGEQANLQLQLLAQIDAAMVSVDDVLGGTIERLTLDLMGSDAERYEYLRTQAEDLAAGLGGLSDPAAIEAAVREIKALTEQGLGLLTPEQIQGGMGAEFIEFLTGVQTNANAQLEATRAATLAQGDLIAQQADVAIAQLEAAERLSAAADAIAGAAANLGSNPIVVQVNLDSDSGALRPI